MASLGGWLASKRVMLRWLVGPMRLGVGVSLPARACLACLLPSVARFGLREWDTAEPATVSPFTGFLAGILLAFDPAAAADLKEGVTAEIDGRRFEFAVSGQSLVPADGPPTVSMTARAADLVAARLAATPGGPRARIPRGDLHRSRRQREPRAQGISPDGGWQLQRLS
jgi:hypothetical protein